MYQLEDTIAAIATPAGIGGIGVIRVSGSKALDTIQSFHTSSKILERKRQISFVKIRDHRSGEILDEALILVMPGPHSYTTEDVVEFHLHGNPRILNKIMEIITSMGVRPADPGEFTYRAFIKGRLDLTQAEAVEALVSSQGDAGRRQAFSQLTGSLSHHLEPLEETLKSLYLKIEARLEFADEGIPQLDLTQFKNEVVEAKKNLGKLLESYRQGKILREGIKVALVGPPNVGKSSLLNILLGSEKAIVTPQAGTTRDIVEGELYLKGVKIRLFDTAGIRESSNIVEAEGVRRSRQIIGEADVIFWVVDASNPEENWQLQEDISLHLGRTYYLMNKMDLIEPDQFSKLKNTSLFPPERCIELSCVTRQGLERVFHLLELLLENPISTENVVLISLRHQQEAEKAYKALENLLDLIVIKQPYELWAEELRESALAVGRIRGRNLTQDAFEEIFSRFCIGK